MINLKDRAAIFLEEMNVSGDTMIEMNHSIDELPPEKIGAYYLHDLLEWFTDKQLRIHGVNHLVCDHNWVHNYQDETKEICEHCYKLRDKQTLKLR